MRQRRRPFLSLARRKASVAAIMLACVLAAFAILVAFADLAVAGSSMDQPSADSLAVRNSGDTSSAAAVEAAGYVKRINAGGTVYTDTQGQVWEADHAYAPGGWGYVGGQTDFVSHTIGGTEDDFLYESERYGLVSYRFTVPNGYYVVILKFAEIYPYYRVGSRQFGVQIENTMALRAFEIYQLVGRYYALDIPVGVQVTDGVLDVSLIPKQGEPKISAISVTADAPPAATPTPTASSTPVETPTPTATSTRVETVTPSATVTETPIAVEPTHTGTPTVTANPEVKRQIWLPVVMSAYRAYFPGPWEIEPNQPAASANGPLYPGRLYFAYPNDERDYFTVDVQAALRISVDVTNLAGLDAQVQIFYRTVTPETRLCYVWSEPYHLDCAAPGPGLYYIFIYVGKGFRTDIPYSFRVNILN